MRELLMDTFRKWLWIEDDITLDIVMATVLSALFPGDPVWLLVIGPPGGGKSELVRALSGHHIYSLDTLTTKSLVSGFKEQGKTATFGILPDLDGKVLVIKDLTVMLQNVSARYEENIFTQLRAAYDGEYSSAHGSGLKRQSYKSTFGVVAAVTPIVDEFRTLSSALGERFITIRHYQSRVDAIRRAQENCGQEKVMRPELSKCTEDAIEYYEELARAGGIPTLDDIEGTKIRKLADITSMLRTEVKRDRERNVVVLPGVEIGTRLVKQFTRLSEMLKLYGAWSYSKLIRVANDSISPLRLKVIKSLHELYTANPNEITAHCLLTHKTVSEYCEDMWMLGICDKEVKGKTNTYSFRPEVKELIVESELF